MMKSLLFLVFSPFGFQLCLANPGSVSTEEISRRHAISTSAVSKFLQIPTQLTSSVSPASRSASSKKTTKASQSAKAETDAINAEVTSCLVSACGASGSNFTAWNTLEPRRVESVNFKNIWEQDLAPLIAADMEDERNFNTELIALLPTKMPAAKLNPNQVLVLKSFLTFKSLGDTLTKLGPYLTSVDTAKATVRLNEAGLAVYKKALSPEMAKAGDFLIKRFLLPMMNMKERIKFTSPLSARLQIFYPNLKDRAALKKDAGKLQQHFKEIQAQYGSAAGTYLVGMSELEKQILNSAARGNVLNGADADLYVILANSIDLYHLPIEKEALGLFPKLNTSFDSVFARAKGSFITNMQGLNKVFALDDAVQETLGICRKNLGLQNAVSVSDFKRNRAELLIAEIKSAAKAVVPKFVSGDQATLIAAAIDKTQFIMPLKDEALLQNFRMKILGHRAFIAEQRKFLKNDSVEVPNFLAVTSVVRTQMQLDSKTKILQDTIRSDCAGIEIDTFSDFAVPPFGQVNVSWASIAYPEYSLGILSHELGHVISGEIRALSLSKPMATAGFHKSLNCVANRNVFQESPVTLLGFENTEWSEEDWADHFSALVSKEMKKRNSRWVENSKSIGCALVAGNRTQYEPNGINPTPGDAHTAPLMRLFNTEFDRGNLTPTCKALFEPTICQ